MAITKYKVGTSTWKKYFVKLGTRVIDGPFFEKKLALEVANRLNASARAAKEAADKRWANASATRQNPAKDKWIKVHAIKINRNGSISLRK